MRTYFIVILIITCTIIFSRQQVQAEQNSTETSFSPGLQYPDGVEPGDPSECEAPNGNRCWWVDADAPGGGSGTFESPANNFREIVGYMDGTSYHQGEIQGGDYLYIRGIFDSSNRLIFRRFSMGGNSLTDNPTVVKTYKGEQRAILDGEYNTSKMIELAYNQGIRFENIEIINANGTGLHSGEGGVNVELAGVVIRDGIADGYIGIGGATLFAFWGNSNQVIVRNCLFYNNKINPTGVLANRGSLSILAESGAGEDSKIEIYNNIFHDEFIAIRHKHSGDVEMQVYNNLIYNCNVGIFIRSWENHIHHNVMYDISDQAIEVLQENQSGNITVEAYNNTIVNTERLVKTSNASMMSGDYELFLNFYNNIFSHPSGGGQTIQVGAISWDPVASTENDFFDITHWISSNNLFHFDQSERGQFILHNGEYHGFFENLAYLNGDISSYKAEPGFVDPDSHDFSLTQNSPARGKADDGGDIGAIPFSPEASMTGDINDSGSVDTIDTMLVLRVMAGSPDTIVNSAETDVGGDGKVGLAEAIYTMRNMVENKQLRILK